MSRANCVTCQTAATLVTGLDVYPHRRDLHHKPFWRCGSCGARVGCHPGTTQPLGVLADAETRLARMAAHSAFDQVWQSGEMSRGAAYGWLAAELGIPSKRCHIGSMDAATARRVVAIVAARG